MMQILVIIPSVILQWLISRQILKSFPIVAELADNDEKNVIQLYIRVSVVLSRQHCRKEREKLDINLDSAVLWECH
jgi:hypothetical protein